MGVYDPVAEQAGRAALLTLDEPLAMQKTKQTRSRFVRIPIQWDRVVCSAVNALPQSDRPGAPNPSALEYVWDRGGGGQFGGWYDYDEEVQQALPRSSSPS